MQRALWISIAALGAACSPPSAAPQTTTAAAQTAEAAPAPMPTRPAELLGAMPQATYEANVLEAAKQDFLHAYGPCETLTTRPVRFDRYLDIVDPKDPMALGLGPEAIALVWRESVEVSGCGTTSVRNVIGAREPGTTAPIAAPSMPGATRVSHGVMRTIGPGVFGAAASVTRACPPEDSDFNVIETRVTQPPPNAADWASPWSEEWIVGVCGQRVRMTMDFAPTPDPGGYDYTARNVTLIPAAAAAP